VSANSSLTERIGRRATRKQNLTNSADGGKTMALTKMTASASFSSLDAGIAGALRLDGAVGGVLLDVVVLGLISSGAAAV
jgi:hypothetical protein